MTNYSSKRAVFVKADDLRWFAASDELLP